MGENPKMVHCVGAIGVDNIRHTPLMNKEELEISLNFKLDEDAALVTFHPVTLENNATEEQFALLLEALDQFQSLHVIFTMPNSDTGGHGIMNMIKYYVNKNAERMVYFESLGAKRYLSVLQYVKVVVGNSSSGIVEVPSFHIPTINIGNRQKGRVAPPSVLHCTPTKDDIVRQLKVALDPDFRKTLQNIKNPYEVKDTAGKILAIVKEQQFDNTVKQFYNVSF
jgi:UDP-hydrolysing UDP-N-acetyl-D-glucosamine 2-epimerase